MKNNIAKCVGHLGCPRALRPGAQSGQGSGGSPALLRDQGLQLLGPSAGGWRERTGCTSLCPASLNPSQAPPRAPSPFRVGIRAAFSRRLLGAQLTLYVVYGSSCSRSRRPLPARPGAHPSFCPRVCLFRRPQIVARSVPG